MAIFEGSRYAQATVLWVQDASGNFNPAIYQRPGFGVQTFTFDHYTTVDGDRFDNLAASFYGDPELWWVLARSNPEVFYPDTIVPGTILRIPGTQFVR